VVEGKIEAASASVAASQLSASGATPIHIIDTALKPGAGARTPTAWHTPRVQLEELVIFCRQMYALTRAGVPVTRALNGLAETTRNPTLARALTDVTNSLHAGRDLSSALERHPRVFPNLFVNTVRMGENSGRLEEAFRDLAGYLERDCETIKRIRSASRYPTMVVLAVACAIAIINVFVIPAFAEVFSELGADLPWPTRILMATSDFFVGYWPAIIAAIVAGVAGWRVWLSTDRGRYLWHGWRLRLPVVGPVLERATLARFSRGFAMTSRAGLPIIQTLGAVARAVDNAFVEDRIQQISDRISRGATLSTSAAASGLFTPLVLQMMAVGEESGSLPELLGEVADYYEREVDHDLKRLSEAIEPLLIVGLGGIVLILALGVYLPLWDMARLAQGG
jgi:MSHA biogenesis protein MshG